MQYGKPTQDRHRTFEAVALLHLDAVHNLARWITHDDQDAQDVAQEAYLRALRYFDGFHGVDVRPWLLQIVRHAWREIPGPSAHDPQAIALRKSERISP